MVKKLIKMRSTNTNTTSRLFLIRLLNKRIDTVGSKRSISESVAFTTIWILVTLSNTLQNGFSSKIPILNIGTASSSSEIRRAWGQGDAGSLLEIAISWSEFKSLDETTQFWIPRLWSPGLALIEVPLIWLEGTGLPLFWTLLALTMVIWGSLTFLVWRYFSPQLGRIPTALALIALIYTWDFGYLLKDYIFYTEGVGYGFLLIGLILMTIRIINPDSITRKCVVFAGIIVGFSVWVRHTSDSGLTFLLVVILLMNLIHMTKKSAKLRTYKQRNSKKKVKLFVESMKLEPESIWIKDLTIFSVIAFLVTVPWRLISTFHFGGYPLAMSSASGNVPFSIWSTPESPSGMYWGVYGSNWACKIDEVTCAIVRSEVEIGIASGSDLLRLAALSAVRNPLKYIDERFGFLFTHWIPNFSLNFSYQNLVALIFFFVFALCFIFFFRIRDHRKYPIAVIWGSFLLMNLLQLSIIHYESRYFIPIRLLCLGVFTGFCLIWSEDRKKKHLTFNSRRISKNSSVR
jgi:hypothetical protein